MNTHINDFEKLLISYFQETLSGKERETLFQLLNSDESLKQQFLEFRKTRSKALVPYFESQKEANYKKLVDHLNFTSSQKRKAKTQYSIRIIKWSAAVILLCLISSISSLYIYNKKDTQRQESFICETVVPYGSQVQITLPDSSTVHLNAGSVLRYNSAYNKNNREVHINGEGFFEVRKHHNLPFVVNASDLKIKVLGTVFNVKAYYNENEIRIGLKEGSVNVFIKEEFVNNRILRPNEELIYNKIDGSMKTNIINADDINYWTTGRLHFRNVSLREIFKALERKYDISIIVDSSSVNDDYFYGSLNTDMSVTEMIERLDVDKKYKWTRNGKTIYVSDK